MKSFFKGIVEKTEDNGLLSVAVASTAAIDRDGEIVDPKGIDTSSFERNPVLLWAHDYRSEPLGKVINLVKEGGRMLFSAQLAVDISPKAKQIFELFKGGYLNAFSIGFIPKEWQDGKSADGKNVRTFTKTELLEISVVPVPANPEALVMVRGMKDIDDTLKKEIELHKDGDVPPKDEDEKPDEEIKEVQAQIRVLTDKVEKLEVASKGEESRAKAPAVEELLRHPDFHRGVLTAIDKAMGNTLRSMKR